MARERVKGKSKFYTYTQIHIIKGISQLVGIKQLKDHYLVCLIKKVLN